MKTFNEYVTEESKQWIRDNYVSEAIYDNMLGIIELLKDDDFVSFLHFYYNERFNKPQYLILRM